jgi:hypothetical protein
MSDRETQIFEMIERYPRLFKGAAPALGITTSPGWDEILRALFHDFDLLLDDEKAKQFRFVQIKEKLGGLRVYYRIGESSEIDPVVENAADSPRDSRFAFVRELLDALISDAEKKALRTCEQCGEPGVLRQSGCMLVTCDACEKLRDDRVPRRT